MSTRDPCMATPSSVTAAHTERILEATRARIATIADEAFGPFPMQSTEENLTAIERGIFDLRQEAEKWRIDGCALVAPAARRATRREVFKVLQEERNRWVTRGEEEGFDKWSRALLALDDLRTALRNRR